MKLLEVNEPSEQRGDTTVQFMDYTEYVQSKLTNEKHDALIKLGSGLIKMGFTSVAWDGKMNSGFYLQKDTVVVALPSRRTMEMQVTNANEVTIQRKDLNPKLATEIVGYCSIEDAVKIDFRKVVALCNRLHADALALRKLVK